MSSFPVSYPVARGVAFAPGRALLGGANIPAWVPRMDGVAPNAALGGFYIDFKNGRYSGKQLSDITTTRSTTKLMLQADGSYTPLGVNVLPLASGLGLLPESQTTNQLLHTQDGLLSGTNWTLLNVLSHAAATAPDGTSNAILHVPDTTATNRKAFEQAVTATAAIWTASVFLKPGGYNFGYLGIGSPSGTFNAIVVDLTSGTITRTTTAGSPTGTSASATRYPNGWCRLQVSMTCVATASQTSIAFGPSPTGTPVTHSSTGEPLFTGDGVSGVYEWAPQLEAGIFATSPVYTTTSVGVRGGDNISLTIPAATSTGTYLAKAQFVNVPISNAMIFGIGDGTTSNEIFALINNLLNANLISGTGVTGISSGSGTVTPGIRQRLAASWSPAGLATSYQGGTIAGNTSFPTGVGMTEFQFGARSANQFYFNNFIEETGFWPGYRASQAALNANGAT